MGRRRGGTAALASGCCFSALLTPQLAVLIVLVACSGCHAEEKGQPAEVQTAQASVSRMELCASPPVDEAIVDCSRCRTNAPFHPHSEAKARTAAAQDAGGQPQPASAVDSAAADPLAATTLALDPAGVDPAGHKHKHHDDYNKHEEHHHEEYKHHEEQHHKPGHHDKGHGSKQGKAGAYEHPDYAATKYGHEFKDNEQLLKLVTHKVQDLYHELKKHGDSSKKHAYESKQHDKQHDDYKHAEHHHKPAGPPKLGSYKTGGHSHYYEKEGAPEYYEAPPASYEPEAPPYYEPEEPPAYDSYSEQPRYGGYEEESLVELSKWPSGTIDDYQSEFFVSVSAPRHASGELGPDCVLDSCFDVSFAGTWIWKGNYGDDVGGGFSTSTRQMFATNDPAAITISGTASKPTSITVRGSWGGSPAYMVKRTTSTGEIPDLLCLIVPPAKCVYEWHDHEGNSARFVGSLTMCPFPTEFRLGDWFAGMYPLKGETGYSFHKNAAITCVFDNTSY